VSQVRTLRPNFTVVTLKMLAAAPQIAKRGNFWYKFDQNGYTPLSDFYKIWLGEGLPSLHPHVKFYRCGFKICGLTAIKIAKIGNFGYIFATKGIYPLQQFLQNLAWGSDSHVPTVTLTFAFVALKMWPYGC